jgi:hypothetical protein
MGSRAVRANTAALSTGDRHGEGIMYPIERTDYINAYIGAISEEMKDARIANPKRRGRIGSFDRFSTAVARLLRTGSGKPWSTEGTQPAA